MKTQEDLNKKIFYRLAKVVYFIVLFVVLFKVGTIFYEKSITYPYNHTKTAITCLVGPNQNDNSDGRIDIKKERYNITGKLTDQQKEQIAKEICEIQATSFIETTTLFSDLFLTHNNFFIASEGVMEKGFKFQYFIGMCLALIIAGIILTEILKRIIYYVVLGTFKPYKK